MKLPNIGIKHAVGQIRLTMLELKDKQLEAEDYFQKLQKGLRKLFLLLEGHQLLLKKIDHLLLNFIQSQSQAQTQVSSLSEEDALELIDLCEKLLQPQAPKQHKEKLQQKILALSGLAPIAQIGKMADTNTDQFTIVDSQPDVNMAKGAVTGIVSQGYVRANSSLVVRAAKVVVSSHAPSP